MGIPVLVLNHCKVQLQSNRLIRIWKERLAVEGHNVKVVNDIKIIKSRRSW